MDLNVDWEPRVEITGENTLTQGPTKSDATSGGRDLVS